MVVDPKPGKPERFSATSLITPNQLEAEKMAGLGIDSDESLRKAADILLEKVSCQAVLITRGEHGMALLEKGRELLTIPTTAREVFDVTGAGDTVISALALGLAAGAPYAVAATLANIAAGVVVAKVGTATVSHWCPSLNSRRKPPVATSQVRAVRSRLAVTIRAPSLEN